ncbi:MAG TPA: c-type cytochrome [Pirellulales bacterium]|jgi:mono/diheme cytochrome c family protein|nr:c-type cytochrome [Pirellulales bacterium]
MRCELPALELAIPSGGCRIDRARAAGPRGAPRRARPVAPGICAALLACVAGCQQKMADQPSYLPLQKSDFFLDQRSARPQVEGTIARDRLQTDSALYHGRQPAGEPAAEAKSNAPLEPGGTNTPANYVEAIPLPIDRQLLARGQERFNIYCAVCHGSLGYGDGIVVQRGYTPPPTYHSDRLRGAPAGYLFEVISHGMGSMPAHEAQIPVRDRWAIVSYLRVLQLSQHAAVSDLSDEERAKLPAQEDSHGTP